MTEEVIIDLKLEQDEGEFAKLAQLKASIVNIKQEQAQLAKAYKEGSITLKEFASESVRLEANQKKLSATYSETQKKVTGLKSPFDKLNESLSSNTAVIDKLIPGMGSAVSGFMSMTKAALAFVATPIGLVLTAVAAAIGAITAAIKTNDAVADDFEAVWSAITAGFHEALRTIGMLGTALVKFLSGDLKGAFNTASDALTGFTDRVIEHTRAGYELARLYQQLEDDTNKYRLAEQATRNEIDKLILQSKDRSKTEQERIALNQQAAELEKKLTEENIALIKRRAEADLTAVGQSVDLSRKRNETLAEYGKRLIESGRVGTDGQNKIVDAVRSVDEALNSSIRLQEKLQNQRNALLDKQEADNQKRRDEQAKKLQKYIDESIAAEKEETERRTKEAEEFEQLKRDNKAAADQAARDAELEAVKIHNDEMYQASLREFEREKTLQTMRKRLAADRISLIMQIGQFAALAFGKSKELAMAALIADRSKAIGEVIINSQEANAKAIAASPLTFGQPWVAINTISAGVSIATIVAATIQALSGFASGGRIEDSMGKPIRRGNGDNRIITAKTGEVILNEQQQAALGGPATFARIGVPGFTKTNIGQTGFAIGGRIPSVVDDTNAMIAKAFDKVKVAVVIEDIERTQGIRARIVEKAQL